MLERIQSEQSGIFGSSVRPILFIDEIHRFSKSQQDSLLAAVEQGIVTLIGATTENPSFEVIRPLLSRCQVYTLGLLSSEEIIGLLQHAIATDDSSPSAASSSPETAAAPTLRWWRRAPCAEYPRAGRPIDDLRPTSGHGRTGQPACADESLGLDKGGELHYDIASALIKSIRGSDPDAAIYWLARLIEGGEDPSFIARRLMISAAEDIGLANPNALLLATLLRRDPRAHRLARGAHPLSRDGHLLSL